MSDHSNDDTDAENDGSRLSLETDRRTGLKGLSAAGVSLGLGALASGTAAADQPANKMGVAGTTMEVLEVAKSDMENPSATHTLLSGSLKTSSPTDLLFQPTAETGLFTDIQTKGNDSSEAFAAITC